jgi:hypothetical protein
MSIGQFAKTISPDVQGIIADKNAVVGVGDMIVRDLPGTEYTTNTLGLTGIGMTGQRDEGTAVTYADPVQGNSKAFTQVLFGQGIKITERLWSYSKFQEVRDLAGMLGDSAAYSREKARVDLLNDGFTAASGTGSDGKELFSLIHPLANSTSTEQNELTTTGTALSDASLQEALYTGALSINHSGLKRAPVYKYLVVPPQLERYAKELCAPGGKPDTSNNNPNMLFPQLQVLSSPLLTSATACFLLADKSQTYLKAYVHQAPALRGPKIDFDSLVIKFALGYEEVLGHDEWFGTFGWEGA